MLKMAKAITHVVDSISDLSDSICDLSDLADSEDIKLTFWGDTNIEKVEDVAMKLREIVEGIANIKE